MEIRGYAVITQFDVDPSKPMNEGSLPPEGPLLHETYMEKSSSLAQARERAEQLRGKYGWVLVAFVCADTDSFYNQEDAARYEATQKDAP